MRRASLVVAFFLAGACTAIIGDRIEQVVGDDMAVADLRTGEDLAGVDLFDPDAGPPDLAGADLTGCDPTSILSCGGCGNVCGTNGALGQACNGTKCSYTCFGTNRDCLQLGANTDGCETNISTSTMHCGGCGNTCNLTGASASSCDGTQCSYTCTGNNRDCVTTAPNLDGCETDITTSTAHCNGCGNACDTVRSTGQACNGTACSYGGCLSGFKDCNTVAPNTNGCETDITTAQNCGDCGVACDTTNSNGPACSTNVCTYSGCKSNRADCNTAAPNANGCETDTTQTNNCGGCNNVCDTTNSVGASCNGNTCQYSSCNPGRLDCNTAAPNTAGCECEGPYCCSTSCAPRHNNCTGAGCTTPNPDLGQQFFALNATDNCASLGNYSDGLAQDARQAWIDSQMPALTGTKYLVSCPSTLGDGRAFGTSGTCATWFFSGDLIGKVHYSNGTGGSPCANACPASVGAATASWQ
jgi:hypothetical protein